MNSSIETTAKNKVKLTINLSPEKFEEGINYAYLKNRASINVSGFRKGKTPRRIIESMYGKEIFYDDALNHILPQVVEDAAAEHNLLPVSRPEIDVVELSTEKDSVITAEFYIKPEVVLGDYMGLKYFKPDTEVTEAEIMQAIDREREKNARTISVSDRPVQDKDIVTIDFEGFIDEVPFENGKGEGYELGIGSNTFIPGFEDQIIGHSLGDEFDVNVTFPEEYNAEELRGKAARFRVVLHEIKVKELPQLDDDFAADVSEFETLDEYKNDLSDKLAKDKVSQADLKKENDIISDLISRCEIDVPEPMIDSQVQQNITTYANRLRQYGMNLETFLSYTGQTVETLSASFRPEAEREVRTKLIMEAIINKEGFSITEEDMDVKLGEMAQMLGIEKDEFKNKYLASAKDDIEYSIKFQKAIDFLMSNAVETDEEPQTPEENQ